MKCSNVPDSCSKMVPKLTLQANTEQEEIDQWFSILVVVDSLNNVILKAKYP